MSNDDETMTPEKLEELFRSRRLPARYPDHVWGGTGSGRDRCAVCSKPIAPDQVGMEAVFNTSNPDGSDDARSFLFHGHCFWILEREWRRIEADAPPSLRPLVATSGEKLDLDRASSE